MNQDPGNRCVDCGAPTQDFLCPRCAEICDKLTSRGEYWERTVRSADRLGIPNHTARKKRFHKAAGRQGALR
jgi:hypothetical protein